MKVDKLTIAVTNTAAMVAFYNTVFDAKIRAIADSPFYSGTFAGTQIMLCPNSIAQVEATKNRIQLRVDVDNIATVVSTAVRNGGGDYGDRHEDESSIVQGIFDPDGNSIELIQQKAPVGPFYTATMHYPVEPKMLEEFVRLWEERILRLAQTQPGFVRMQLLTRFDEALAMGTWQTKKHAEAFMSLGPFRGLMASLKGILTGAPKPIVWDLAAFESR